MKPKARIKVTLSCNKRCPYCINKDEQYRKKWIPIKDIYSVNWSDFRSVVISGGEPTLYKRYHDQSEGLISIVRLLRKYILPDTTIYLQTNGYLLTKSLVKSIDDFIDGIGLSIHDLEEFDHLYPRFQDILRIKPIRLYVNENMVSEDSDMVKKWKQDGFGIRIWREGEFDESERIFVLE